VIIEIGQTATQTSSTGCYGSILQNSRNSKAINDGITNQALKPARIKKPKPLSQQAIPDKAVIENATTISPVSPEPFRKPDSPICSQAESSIPIPALVDAATNTDSVVLMDTENLEYPPPDRSPNANVAFYNVRWFPARIPNQLAITDGRENTPPTVFEAMARERTVQMLDRIWTKLREPEPEEVKSEEYSRFQIRIIDQGTTERQARSYTIYRFDEAAGLELAQELEYIPPTDVFYTVPR